MKMTKIETARFIASYDEKKNGKERCFISCNGIDCKDCFNFVNGKDCCDDRDEKIEKAKAYIKRHEAKKKKKPKTVGIDNSDVTISTVKENLTVEPTPLEIAKIIKDNNYKCLGFVSRCDICPLYAIEDCGNGANIATQKERDLRKKLIDDYIAQHDHIVDKHEMVEPKPISFDDPVPEYVYIVTNYGVLRKEVVQFVHQRYKTQKPDMFILTVGGNTMSFDDCYRTLEEAVIVAKKQWGVK